MAEDKKTENENKDNHVDKLRKVYSELEEKYSLPKFEELNNEFTIEKADSDSELPLREIIRLIADKFQNYMRFIETVINPSNASSIFAFSFTKLVDNGKKTKLSEAYKEISKFEVKLIRIDLESSEETEPEFIKYSYETWKKIKEDIKEIVEFVEKNWESTAEQVKKSNYFN
jgi:hypothetical protein